MYRPLQSLSRGGGICLGGVCPMGRGVRLEGDVCLGGVCLRGVSAWGCLPKGSVCQWVYTFPPVDRMTDTCENITFPSGGFRGAPPACAPLRPKIFSISCSFSQNLAKSYVGARTWRVGAWIRPCFRNYCCGRL